MIQIGNINLRVFLIGGGEYKTLSDNMFQCREMLKRESYYFVIKNTYSMLDTATPWHPLVKGALWYMVQ
jgi:hypothetical protein